MTLLRVILDAHPSISCGPDVGHVALTMTSADFETTLGDLHREHFHLERDEVRARFARAIAAPMRKRASLNAKRRWADKSAFNVLVFDRLAALFPDARFIHLVRDGRDLAASLLERRWRAPSGAVFDHCASVAGAARYWASLTQRGLEEETLLGDRVLRIRYEDLAARPSETMQAICAFLVEPFEPTIVALEDRRPTLAGLELETADRLRRSVNQSAVGRWRRDLAADDAAAVFEAFRPLFETLGYQS
jgi:hypothetical protein